MRFSRGQAENYGISSIRGNQINFVFHPPRDFPMACGPFFLAPVPSGCTFTDVESKLKASILSRRICFCCNFANT